jgi:hypothetical protein
LTQLVAKKDLMAENNAAPAADKGNTKKTMVEETIHTPKEYELSPEVQEIVFEELESTDESLLRKHPQLLKLSRTSDYGAIYRILKDYPDLSKNEAFDEALLLRALCKEIVGQASEARNCVLVSLILKFTRSLGENSLETFFTK